MKGLGLSVLSSLVSCAVWAAESTLLDGKVVITSDDDTGSITSLVATPSGGETLTIPSDAGTMAFAAGARIEMAADGRLIFANDVTAAGELSLVRTDGNFYAYNWTGTAPMTNEYVTPLPGTIKFKQWHVESAFANAKGNRSTLSRGNYTCVYRPSYGATTANGFYRLNRWDGDHTYSMRIQTSTANAAVGDFRMRLNTVVQAPLYERRLTEELWVTGANSHMGEAGWKWWYIKKAEYPQLAATYSGNVDAAAIDRVVLKKIGSAVSTIGFAGNVTLNGMTDIALGVKLAVLPKSGSTFAAPIFTGEGDVEYQRNATLAVGNELKYASALIITNGASVTVTHNGGLPTNGVVTVWNGSTLTLNASGLNNGQGISGGRPDIRVHPGATFVWGDQNGMAPRDTRQLFEFDAATAWLGSSKKHMDTEPKMHYVNRIALLNGTVLDGNIIRVGNDTSIAPCWMVKGSSPSTVGCHIWYFGNGRGTNPSKSFTFDVEDVTESTAVDLTMNGDILRGISGATDWSGAIVKSGAGTLLMNGKLTMTRPMQVNGGAFIFGDTGGPAEGADTVSPTSLKDGSVNVIDAAATSTQRDVVLAGATLGKTAGALALDTLTVTGGGTLELGPTATMFFADSSAKAWSGRLTLAGWRARAVRFGTSAEGLTAEQCRLIRTAEGLKLHLDSDGYLVPIGFKFAVR